MSELANRTFTADEKAKVKNTVQMAVKTLREIGDLREGLSDTVKAVAEQLDVKPKLINGAIRAAYKQDLLERRANLSDVEEILEMAGLKGAAE